MRITSSVEYAARLMVQLGRSFGERPLSAAQLSQLENIPSDYVNQLLVRLRRAGLLQSQRGTAGGYLLSRPPSEINLGDVIRATEGRIFEDVCGKYSEGRKDCHHQSHCQVSPVWKRLGLLIEQYLDGITLSQILEESGSCGAVFAAWEKTAAPILRGFKGES